MKKLSVALIDLDIIVHKACFYHQYRMDEDDPELENVCKEAAWDMLREWISLSGCVVGIPVYSMPGVKNFRHYLHEDYKANRKDKPQPIYKQQCFDYITEKMGSLTAEGIEADDILGLLHCNLDPEKYDTVLVTTDKDLRQVPGKAFNPDKDWAPVEISDYAGLRFLAIQSLMGDSTDNIPGIKGMGIKKATKLVDQWLEEGTEAFDLKYKVCEEYLAQGYSYEFCVMNYDLVNIYTTEDEWPSVHQLKQSTEELILGQLEMASSRGTTPSSESPTTVVSD